MEFLYLELVLCCDGESTVEAASTILNFTGCHNCVCWHKHDNHFSGVLAFKSIEELNIALTRIQIHNDNPNKKFVVHVKNLDGYYVRETLPLEEDESETLKFARELSTVTEALAAGNYHKIAVICDTLMLKVSAEGVAFQADWPYAVHLLGHIYADDIISAEVLWESIPDLAKESQPEVGAVWKMGQEMLAVVDVGNFDKKMQAKNFARVYETLHSFNWSPQIQPFVTAFSETYTKKMFQLLLAAYSTISVQDTSLFLGMNEDDATKYVLQEGWSLDSASKMFTVKNQSIVAEQNETPANCSG